MQNINEKETEFNKLLKELSECDKCINFKNEQKSLINIYKEKNFCKNIPSIWTDWFNRLDSKIMIIGQDWGPHNDMKHFNSLLNQDKSNWKEIVELEKSNTKKMLEYYIKTSSGGRYSLDDIFITNAIMCARQGENYRGNNIDLNKSTISCSEYLLKQISIVKPKIILPLGYYPLKALSEILNFNIENTLKNTIEKYPEIKVNDYTIIPLYHPVAQVKKEDQMKQYNRIWKFKI